MFRLHKINKLLNTNLQIKLIKNKSEIIINTFINLKYFKHTYYVNLLWIALTDKYINLEDILKFGKINTLFSTKSIITQIMVINKINSILNTNNYSFFNKLFIILKVFKNIFLNEILVLKFVKKSIMFKVKKFFKNLQLIILEYRYSYLVLTKLNKFIIRVYYKDLYINKLNYFFITYNRKSFFKFLINLKSYLSLLKIYNFTKTVAIPTFISLIMIFLLINFFKVEIYTNIGIWCVLGFFFLWLMSGFNFFIKRYKNGKFTSSIQRFWKRTNAYFWLVEGFLFTLFFYYYVNSSQEPLYTYDESNLNQVFLPNLVAFFFTILVLLFIIFYSYYLILNIPTMSSKQQILHLVVNSILMIYVFLLESYQFYYLVNTFYEISWDYLEEFKLWSLEFENPKIRVKTQYLTLALIAKYWHFIFIFFTWLFLLYKSYERKKIYYPIFGFLIQNCIILLLLNILFCVQWVKWIIRRYYDTVYYWFFTDTNNTYITDLTDLFSLFSLF